MIKKISSLLLLALLVLLCAAGCQKNDTSDGKMENSGSAGSGVISADSGAEKSEADKFAESILNNAYSEAIAVYNAEIKGNAGLEQEAADYMASYLGEIKSDVLSGACSESDAKAKMTTVKNVCSKTGCDVEGYETLVGAVDQAISSKTAYKSGIALLAQKNYKDAFAELKKVLPDDSDYADANEKYFAAVESYKKEVKSSADTLISGGDYLAALDAYKQAVEILPEDSDLLAGMNTCEKGYISDAVNRAASVFSDYTKYEEALKIIQAGLQYFPDNQILIDKKEYYNLFAPVELTNLKKYDEYNIKINENLEDPKGTNHQNVIETSSHWVSDKGYVVYVLDGKYNKITFTIFGLNPGYDYLSGVSLRDYSTGDYESSISLFNDEQIKCSVLPYELEIDVTGVQMLRVWCTTGIAVSDCILQRTAK